MSRTKKSQSTSDVSLSAAKLKELFKTQLYISEHLYFIERSEREVPKVVKLSHWKLLGLIHTHVLHSGEGFLPRLKPK